MDYTGLNWLHDPELDARFGPLACPDHLEQREGQPDPRTRAVPDEILAWQQANGALVKLLDNGAIEQRRRPSSRPGHEPTCPACTKALRAALEHRMMVRLSRGLVEGL